MAIIKKSDGTFWGVGYNANGSLGLGHTISPITTWTQIPIDNVKQLEYSQTGVIVLKYDGTLWSVGSNNGITGQNTTSGNTINWTQIGTDNDWKLISVGISGHIASAIKNDGTLWAWGIASGTIEIYNSNTVSYTVLSPMKISNDTDWKSVCSGETYIHAIKNDGTLWVKGRCNYGGLGTGVLSGNTNFQFAKIGTDTWKKISTYYNLTIGIKNDGTLWSTGGDSSSSYGNGLDTTTIYPSFMQIGTDNNWVDISVGFCNAMAIKSNGTLWSWGKNSFISVIVGDNGLNGISTRTPLQIGTDNDWTRLYYNFTASYALKSNGRLYSCGYNAHYQLGTSDNKNRLVLTHSNNNVIGINGQENIEPWTEFTETTDLDFSSGVLTDVVAKNDALELNSSLLTEQLAYGSTPSISGRSSITNTWLGWQFTVGSKDLQINEIGDLGNNFASISRPIRIYDITNDTLVIQESVSINYLPSYSYKKLTTPVILKSGTTYAIETNSGSGSNFGVPSVANNITPISQDFTFDGRTSTRYYCFPNFKYQVVNKPSTGNRIISLDISDISKQLNISWNTNTPENTNIDIQYSFNNIDYTSISNGQNLTNLLSPIYIKQILSTTNPDISPQLLDVTYKLVGSEPDEHFEQFTSSEFSFNSFATTSAIVDRYYQNASSQFIFNSQNSVVVANIQNASSEFSFSSNNNVLTTNIQSASSEFSFNSSATTSGITERYFQKSESEFSFDSFNSATLTALQNTQSEFSFDANNSVVAKHIQNQSSEFEFNQSVNVKASHIQNASSSFTFDGSAKQVASKYNVEYYNETNTVMLPFSPTRYDVTEDFTDDAFAYNIYPLSTNPGNDNKWYRSGSTFRSGYMSGSGISSTVSIEFAIPSNATKIYGANCSFYAKRVTGGSCNYTVYENGVSVKNQSLTLTLDVLTKVEFGDIFKPGKNYRVDIKITRGSESFSPQLWIDDFRISYDYAAYVSPLETIKTINTNNIKEIKDIKVNWVEEKPANTNIQYFVSEDQVVWTPILNGQTYNPTSKITKFYLKEILSTTDNTVTPKRTSLNVVIGGSSRANIISVGVNGNYRIFAKSYVNIVETTTQDFNTGELVNVVAKDNTLQLTSLPEQFKSINELIDNKSIVYTGYEYRSQYNDFKILDINNNSIEFYAEIPKYTRTTTMRLEVEITNGHFIDGENEYIEFFVDGVFVEKYHGFSPKMSVSFLQPGIHHFKLRIKGNTNPDIYSCRLTSIRKYFTYYAGTFSNSGYRIQQYNVSNLVKLTNVVVDYNAETPVGTNISLDVSTDKVNWIQITKGQSISQLNGVYDCEYLYIRQNLSTSDSLVTPKLLDMNLYAANFIVISHGFKNEYLIKHYVIQFVIPNYAIKDTKDMNINSNYNIKDEISHNFDVDYNLKDKVDNNIISNYNVKDKLAKNFNNYYAIKTPIENSFINEYNVKFILDSMFGFNYGVKNELTETINNHYAIKQPQYINISSNYNIKNQISDNFDVDYNVKAKVLADIIFKYALKNELVENVPGYYGIKNALNQNLIANFNVTNTISNNFDVDYNTKTLITNEMDIAYALKNLLQKYVVSQYPIKNTLEKEITTNYGIKDKLKNNIVSNYGIKNKIKYNLNPHYNIIRTLSNKFKFEYRIFANNTVEFIEDTNSDFSKGTLNNVEVQNNALRLKYNTTNMNGTINSTLFSNKEYQTSGSWNYTNLPNFTNQIVYELNVPDHTELRSATLNFWLWIGERTTANSFNVYFDDILINSYKMDTALTREINVDIASRIRNKPGKHYLKMTYTGSYGVFGGISKDVKITYDASLKNYVSIGTRINSFDISGAGRPKRITINHVSTIPPQTSIDFDVSLDGINWYSINNYSAIATTYSDILYVRQVLRTNNSNVTPILDKMHLIVANSVIVYEGVSAKYNVKNAIDNQNVVKYGIKNTLDKQTDVDYGIKRKMYVDNVASYVIKTLLEHNIFADYSIFNELPLEMLVTANYGVKRDAVYDLFTQYNIKLPISDEFDVDYNTKIVVDSNFKFDYAVRKQIAKAIYTKYNIKVDLDNDFMGFYQVKSTSTIESSFNVGYNVKNLLIVQHNGKYMVMAIDPLIGDLFVGTSDKETILKGIIDTDDILIGQINLDYDLIGIIDDDSQIIGTIDLGGSNL